MDARVQQKHKQFLPTLADAIAEWFPELKGRSVAVSEVDINKENVPTLPLCMVAFLRSVADPPVNSRVESFTMTDAFIVEFWLKPLRYEGKNGAETPFWSYYDYEDVRDTLLTNLAFWETPNGEKIVYRRLNVEAEHVAVTLTFEFTATFSWCPSKIPRGEPFKIGFNLCTPAGCIPPICEEEPDPCASEDIERPPPVPVVPVPPTITNSNVVANLENDFLAHPLASDQAVTWSIVGGADAAKFEIISSVLRWLGDAVKDFETPEDADSNNSYVVTVRATNLKGLTAEQTITVTVNDVLELWSPAKMPLCAWYDASDAANVNMTGALVNHWVDLSGNNNDLVFEGTRPSYATVNGVGTISFDFGAILGKSGIAGFPATNDSYLTMVGVLRMKAGGSGRAIYDFTDAGLLTNTTGSMLFENAVMKIRCGGTGADVSVPFDDYVNPHMWSVLMQRADRRLRVDGQPITANTTVMSPYAYTNMRLGMLFQDVYPLVGDMTELIFFEGNDPAASQKCEGYLAHKYGYAGSLPADHPYKNAPP